MRVSVANIPPPTPSPGTHNITHRIYYHMNVTSNDGRRVSETKAYACPSMRKTIAGVFGSHGVDSEGSDWFHPRALYLGIAKVVAL